MNVLIIDNNKAQQAYLKALVIHIEPTAMIYCTNCNSALRNIKTIHNLDYITLEQKLKISEGIELVPLIRETLPHCKIIMITTKCNPALKSKATELGISYLSKPIIPSNLKSLIS